MDNLLRFVKTPLGMVASGVLLLGLVCSCCVGFTLLLSNTSSNTGQMFASTSDPALRLGTATNTPPGIPTDIVSATYTLLATFAPTTAPVLSTWTTVPGAAPATASFTPIPPTAVPPTLVPTAIPTSTPIPPTQAPAIVCQDRDCPSFNTCQEVLDFLNACPQYWGDLDGNDDGTPCESVCE